VVAATDLDEQKRVAAPLQDQAFSDVPLLPFGQFFQPTAQSRRLEGGLQGMLLFWNIRRRT
jgi:peptide/nickel transport system substrate-binding protein